MKDKFFKISSVIMAPICLMITIFEATHNNWALATAWAVSTTIWICNIKLYWND